MKLSAQLARDLLFRKFCRLELDAGVPEASTLGRFRAALEDRMQALLAVVVAALEENRVILTEGRIAIVDGEARARHGFERRAERDGGGAVPAGDPRSRRYPGAGSRVKINARGRKVGVWGWQASLDADADGFIRRVAVSPGNRAEVDSPFAVVAGDGAALYADSAYVGPRTRALLARHGMADRVQRRGAWRHPLSAEARAQNAEIGVTRARIEAIFGHWKRHWGFRRTRFLGQAKMRILAGLAAIGWNLWKGARFRTLYG